MKAIVTHDGSFHTDDLFAAATLVTYCKKNGFEYKLVRTRDTSIIESADIVFDVGGLYDPEKSRFDHHQKEGAGERQNGTPYASFGLIWKHYGLDICNNIEKIWKDIDERLVSTIDSVDNGVSIIETTRYGIKPTLIEDAFMVFSPTWQEADKNDSVFFELVDMVAKYLTRKIDVAMQDQEGESVLKQVYSEASAKQVLEIPGGLPRYLYQNIYSQYKDVLYVVYPSTNDSSWKAEAIRKDEKTMESRLPFPESWRGMMIDNGEVGTVTTENGLLFCHRNGFLLSARTKEDVYRLIDLSLKQLS